MRKFLHLLCVTGIITITNSAYGACDNHVTAQFQPAVAFDMTGYDPFIGQNFVQTATLILTDGTNTHSDCKGMLTITHFTAPALKGSLEMTATNGASVIANNTPVGSTLIDFDFKNKANVVIPVTFLYRSQPQNIIENQTYSVDISFLPLGQDNHNIGTGNSQNFHFTIPTIRHISVGGSGYSDNRHSSLDFGDVKTGDTQNFNLFVRSSAPYQVQVHSDNGGKLVRTQSAHVQNDEFIPYTINNGFNVEITDKIFITNGTATTATGTPHNVGITIGDVVNKRAGHYSDTLTFTIIGS